MAFLRIVILAAVTYIPLRIVTTIVYRLFFHPLATVPGPRLAAITWNYERYYDLYIGAKFWEKIKSLHEEYGPIIRINPNEVHIIDPELIDTVYPGGGRRVNKDPYLMNAFGLLHDALFMTLEHDPWKMRRNAMNRYFSKAAVNKFEPYIKEMCDKFTRRLLEYRNDGPITISAAYSSFTTDVISEYAFGKSFEYLDRDKFLPNMQPASDGFGALLPTLRMFPWMSAAMRMMSNEQLVKMDPGMGEWLAMEATCEQHVVDAKGRLNNEKTTQKYYNIIDELLQHDMPESEKDTHRLALEAQGLMGAATETTAWALSLATFHIYWDREIMRKLQQELLAESPTGGLPSLAKLEAMPYFSAIVTETLRHSGGPLSRLPRIFPDDATVLRSSYKTPDGKPVECTVPPGTVISMSSKFIHMNPELFPDPHAFKPERWLDSDGKRKRDMERYLMHFSKGTRGCVGLNLAMAEIYMCLAALVLQVGEGVELFETDLRDVEPVYDNFAPRAYKGTQGIRVIIK